MSDDPIAKAKQFIERYDTNPNAPGLQIDYGKLYTADFTIHYVDPDTGLLGSGGDGYIGYIPNVEKHLEEELAVLDVPKKLDLGKLPYFNTDDAKDFFVDLDSLPQRELTKVLDTIADSNHFTPLGGGVSFTRDFHLKTIERFFEDNPEEVDNYPSLARSIQVYLKKVEEAKARAHADPSNELKFLMTARPGELMKHLSVAGPLEKARAGIILEKFRPDVYNVVGIVGFEELNIGFFKSRRRGKRASQVDSDDVLAKFLLLKAVEDNGRGAFGTYYNGFIQITGISQASGPEGSRLFLMYSVNDELMPTKLANILLGR